MGMGNVNSLKGILLFAVRNGYREVHVSKGNLPLLVSGQGEKAYVNGIAPINGELINSIKRDYMANNPTLILTVCDQEFFASSVGDDLVFRHLPYVTQEKTINTRLASALFSKKGIVVLTSSEKEERFLKLYRAIAYLASNRSATIAVIERSKYFTIKPVYSKLINIYRPEAELSQLVRIAGSLEYDCMMIPDFNEPEALKAIEFIAGERLVLVSSNQELASKINGEQIIYADYIEDELNRASLRPNIKINRSVITENLKGE